MVKRKRSSKSYKPRKRRFTKRKFFRARKYRRRAGIPFGTPDQKYKVVRLRYCDLLTLDVAAAGGIVSDLFRANGPYDPYQPVGGHQPMGWDQMAAIYNHYVVLGAKIKCVFTPRTSDTGAAVIAGIDVVDDATFTTATRTTLLEQKKARYLAANTSNSTRPVVITKKFSTKKFFNIKDVKDNVTRLGAPTSNLPTEEAFFRIFMMSADATAAHDPNPYDVFVTLDYIILFGEPREFPAS